MIILGLTGRAGCGKDAAASFLVEDGFTRISFADPLRAMAYDLNPIVDWHDRVPVYLQTVVDRDGWDVAKRIYPEVRVVLQRLGTDVVRNHVSPNFWVERAFSGMKKNGTGKYVLTDIRFPQEFQAVVDAKGIVVGISRPGLAALPGNHASETALAGIDPDLTIENDQDLSFLGESIRALARWKRCRDCDVVQSPEAYMTNPRLAQGLHSYCRTCEASRMRAWRAKDPEGAARKERGRHLLSAYGITIEKFDEMLDDQGGKCAICAVVFDSDGRSPAVDHNHSTGATRGILCSTCNSALGRVEAVPDWCASALAYLKNYA